MRWLHYNLALIVIALGFLTRIPVVTIEFSEPRLNDAARYFPLIGWLIGGLCGVVYWLALQGFEQPVAVVLMMGFSVILTGAFHEDGLADTADGCGGWTVEQKLSIMKDSRLGTYGGVALCLMLLVKFSVLSEMADLTDVVIALLVAHPLSRVIATLLIGCLDYVRLDGQSKVRPLAQSLSVSNIVIILFTALPAFCLAGDHLVGIAIGCVVLFIVIRYWLMRQLGGFTGDALGAAQQLSELGIYLILIADFSVNRLPFSVVMERMFTGRVL